LKAESNTKRSAASLLSGVIYINLGAREEREARGAGGRMSQSSVFGKDTPVFKKKGAVLIDSKRLDLHSLLKERREEQKNAWPPYPHRFA
jgi:hypothetical protein